MAASLSLITSVQEIKSKTELDFPISLSYSLLITNDLQGGLVLLVYT